MRDSIGTHYASQRHSVPADVSHGVTLTTQHPLFKDILAERLAATGADVDAAGGEKTVAVLLWPNLKPDTATRRMSNALNVKQRHALTDDEVWQIKQLARRANGRSHLHEYESACLEFEGKWLTTEDIKARRRKRKAVLLAELVKLEQEEE